MKRIKQNKLVIPNYNKHNLIDLLRVLYNYCGTNYKVNNNMKEIRKDVKNNKNIIFILVDGLGYNLVNTLPNDSILKKNYKRKLNTVFPTATGCVLNSVITGEYPSKTGFFGWYAYNRENNIPYYTLLLNDRITNENLKLDDKDIFKYDSIFNKLNRNTNIVFPEFLLTSRFSKHVIGKNKSYGYKDYENAFNIISNIIKDKNETFTYLYLPEIDTLEHKNGVYKEIVYNKINELEKALTNFVRNNNNFEIVLTADHGQVDIENIITMYLDKYNKYFYTLPSIDLGTSTFFVKEEYKEIFKKEFEKDFRDSMILYKTKDLIDNNFFGKNMTKYAESCLGEYVSLCKKGYAFYNRVNKYTEEDRIYGNHTGLTKEEIEIPLIVINK